MSRFKKAFNIAGNTLQQGTGGNAGAFVGAGVGAMVGGPMGASVGMGLGSLVDNQYKQNTEQRKLNKELKKFERENKPKFIDPRKGRQSALSQFSVNPSQGRQGQASSSMLMNMSSMYPSLLR